MHWEESEKRLLLSRIYEWKGRRDWEQMEDEAKTALDRYPDEIRFELALADAYRQQKRLDEARSLMASLKQRGQGIADYHALQGEFLLDAQRHRQAYEEFRQAHSLQERPFYLKRQADSLIPLKRHQEALALLKQLDDRDTNPFILSSLARCHEGLGQNEEARRCYQDLLRIRPGDEFASSRLLQLKVEEKRPEEAEQELDRMLRLPSRRDDPALLKVKAEQMKKRGDFAAAADIYSRLAESCDPGQRTFYQRMSAFALNKAGRNEEAWAAFRKLIEKDPADHYVRSALISVARKLGRDAELADFFENLARQSPANRPLFGLARKIRKRIKE